MSKDLASVFGRTTLTQQVSREIEVRRSGTQIRCADAYNAVDVHIAIQGAIDMATMTAQAGIARVAQHQTALELLVPEATGELAFIKTAHVLASADALGDLARKLRNIQ